MTDQLYGLIQRFAQGDLNEELALAELASIRGEASNAPAASRGYLEQRWEERSLQRDRPVDAPVVVCAESADLASALRARGASVVSVSPVDVNWELTAQSASRAGALTIVFSPPFVLSELQGIQEDEEWVRCSSELSTRCLSDLMRAVRASLATRPSSLRILVVGDCSNQGTAPLLDASAAFGRTLSVEHPEVSWVTLRLDPALKGISLRADAVLAELEAWGAGCEERMVRSPAQRFVRRLAVCSAERQNTALEMARGGTVLLTGASGGLGRMLTEYLIDTYDARVVAVARRPLEHTSAAWQRRIAASFSADVSEFGEVRRVVRETRARLGAIDAVVHCAGVVRDGLIRGKSEAQVREVWAGKVLGALHLDRATADQPPRLFVVASSLAAHVGNTGQSDYAAANALLGGFADWRQENRSGCSRAIAWGPLACDGMQGDVERERLWQERLGLVSLTAAQITAAFEDAVGGPRSNLAVMGGDASRLLGALHAPRAQPVEGDSKVGEKDVEEIVVDVVVKRLRIPRERLSKTTAFEDYGVDSISAVRMIEDLEEHCGPLPKTLFFEHDCIASLAKHLSIHHPARQAVERTPSASPIVVRAEERVTKQSGTAEPLAIVGMAGRFPMADSVQELWENLLQGRDCVTEVPAERWRHDEIFSTDESQPGKTYGKWGGFLRDIRRFDARFFKIAPRDAAFMDPQERIFLEVAWETLEDAGYTPQRLAQSVAREVGVFVGAMFGHYQLLGAERTGQGVPTAVDSSFASIANRVSYAFDFVGPSLTLDSMCSSSLAALHYGCESIRRGECKAALVGGVNVMSHPNKYLLLAQAKFLSHDGRCRSFGRGGDGYVPGEGVASVLIRPLSDAVRDGDHIYGVIGGSAINHGGKATHYTVPSVQAQSAVIGKALAQAGLVPSDVTYVEAHGTGTSLGDPIELRGLHGAFGESARPYCALGSIKSNLGHLESAAGIAALVKVLLQIQHRKLVPSLHSDELNPHLDFAGSPFALQHRVAHWAADVRRAGVSSFGAGGTNVHVIVEEASVAADQAQQRGPFLALVAARTERALRDRARELRVWLERNAGRASLADVTFTLAMGRDHQGIRRAFVVDDHEGLVRELAALEADIRHGSAFRTGLSDVPASFLRTAEAYVANDEPADFEAAFTQGRRVSLPTYPFAREQHWLARGESRSLEPQATSSQRGPTLASRTPDSASVDKLTRLRLAWVESDTRQVAAAGAVLWAGAGEAALECSRLTDRALVSRRPAESWGEALSRLRTSATSVSAIILCLPDAAFDRAQVGDQLQSGLGELVELTRALLQQPSSAPEVRVLCVCPGRAADNPLQLATAGFARSAMRESKRLDLRVVRVRQGDAEHVSAAIASELRQAHGRCAEVSYDEGCRRVPILQDDPHSPHAAGLSIQEGVYLIAGGTGGLGSQIGLALARRARATVVLLGRREPAASLLAEIRALDAPGRVVFRACDVCDVQAVEATVAALRGEYGPIRGVVQAGGTISDRLLGEKTTAEFDAVLAAKVHGTLALDHATKSEPLAFFAMFSSLTSVTGNAGQTDYGAANAFLDHFARLRETEVASGLRRGRNVSLNWSLWNSGGMRPSASVEAHLEEQFGLLPIEPEQGVQAFFDALDADQTQLVLLRGDGNMLERLAGRAEPSTANTPASNRDVPQQSRWSVERIRSELQEMAGAVLQMSTKDIDCSVSLAEFGFQSIALKELASQVTDRFGVPIAPTLFFEHDTVAELADYLRTRLAAQPVPAAQPVVGRVPATPVIARASGERALRVSTPSSDALAIVGIAVRFPGSANLAEFWAHLAAGDDLIRELPEGRWGASLGPSVPTRAGYIDDVESFDASFFRIPPREASLMDPQHRLFLQTAYAAIEHAGVAPSSLAGRAVGVFAGVQFHDYEQRVAASGEAHPTVATGNAHAMLPNRVSYLLDLHGPSEAVDTACSSSLVALARARQSLLSGESESALVGGVSLLLDPATLRVTHGLGVLSPDARCQAFGARANGYVKGEGVAVVFVKTLHAALRDGDTVHAVVRSSLVNHGGRARSLTAPNARAQGELIRRSLEMASIPSSSIGYVEAHGTGTELGDPIEMEGLKLGFGEQAADAAPCFVGSVKSNIGHLEPAAGIAGLVKAVLAVQRGQIPRSLHCDEPNPYLGLQGTRFRLPLALEAWPVLRGPRRACVSSFGFGGTNAHVVIEQAPEQPTHLGSASVYLVPVSAQSPAALSRQLANLAACLEPSPSLASLSDLAFTLAMGRDHHACRRTFVVESIAQLRSELQSALAAGNPASARASEGVSSTLLAELQAALMSALREASLTEAMRRSKLAALGELYELGYALDWAQLAGPGRRIPLPTYSFERERHWIDFPSPAAEKGDGLRSFEVVGGLTPTVREKVSATGSARMFVPRWKASGEQVTSRLRKVDGPILIVLRADQAQLAHDVRAALGNAVVHEIASDDPVVIDSVVGQLRSLRHILYLAAYGLRTGSDAQALVAQQEDALLPLYRVARALNRYGLSGQPLTLRVVVDGAFPVRAHERISPVAAATSAFARALVKELPGWSLDVLDLPPNDDVTASEQVLRALRASEGGDKPLAWRQEVTHRLSFEMHERTPADTRFRKGGAYLIVGGAGGIGSELARYLGTVYKAKVALMGRRAEPATLASLRAEIAAAGGALEYVQGDVATLEGAHSAIQRTLACVGGLHGVIHSALVLEDRTVANMEEASLRRVLAPKLRGSVFLAEALRELSLDFLLFFSSAQSVLCDAGQSNYAAGSAFQDAFAHWLRSLVSFPVQTVDWGYWGSVGVVAEPRYAARLAALGIGSIEVQEGLQAVEDVLAQGLAHAVFLRATDATFEALGFGAQASTPAAAVLLAPELAANDAAQTTAILAEIVAQALGVAVRSVNPETSLADHGIDSLVAVDVAQKISQRLRVRLRTVDLFDHPTLSRLSAHIVKMRPVIVPTVTVEPLERASARGGEPSLSVETVRSSISLSETNTDLPGALSAQESGAQKGLAIAVVGVSCRFPGARDTQEFWANLRSGRNVIGRPPADRGYAAESADLRGGYLDGLYEFDARFFGLSGREAELMDPQQRIFLQAAWNALEDAGCARDASSRLNCGVFVGCYPGDYKFVIERAGVRDEPHVLTGNSEAILAARVSYLLDLSGPAIAIDTACSSSLVALKLACDSMASGTCGMALVGGVTAFSTADFHRLARSAGMLSPNARCATFDASADGFVPAEGVGAIVLKPLAQAQRDGDRLYGVIRAAGINQDGKTNGITAPSAASQAQLIRETYARYGIDPKSIGYIEAHGTGTRLGDPIELTALEEVFQPHAHGKPWPIGSVKTNIGHALPASGMASLIKGLLCLEHRALVPSLHYATPNPEVSGSSLFEVGRQVRELECRPGFQSRRIAISAFGFSGTNAHVVLEEAPAKAHVVDDAGNELVVLSAVTKQALRSRLHEIAAWIEERPTLTLAEISFTSCCASSFLEQRFAAVVRSKDELVTILREALLSEEVAGLRTSPVAHSGGRESLVELGRRFSQGDRAALLREAWAGRIGSRVALPGYPFARDSFRIDAPSASARTDASASAPSPSDVLAQMNARTEVLATRAETLVPLAASFNKLEALARLELVRVVADLGLLDVHDGRYFVRPLAELAPQYKRLWSCLKSIVESVDATVFQDGTSGLATRCLPHRIGAAELQQVRSELRRVHPHLEPHVDLLHACVSVYPSVLKGEVDPIAVMFPSGSMRLVEGVYAGNALVDYYNAIVASAVCAFVSARPGQKLRIVEVGAGTGGTSATVLPALAPFGDRIEYVYTDVSKRFVSHGESAFGSRFPFTRFQTLDLEAQDVAFPEADLVLGTNVLHATRNMQRTLSRIARGLRPDGVLVVSELMERRDFATMTFGLTGGWWLYDDEARRIPGSPLLALENWEQLLSDVGFRSLRKLDSDCAGLSSSHVVAALQTSEQPLQSARVDAHHVPYPEIAAAKPNANAPDDIVTALRETLAHELRIPAERIGLADPFERLGMDSLVSLRIMEALERRFGKHPRTVLLDHPTVQELATHLAAQQPTATPAEHAQQVTNRDEADSIFRAELLRAGIAEPLERSRMSLGERGTWETLTIGRGAPFVMLAPLNMRSLAFLPHVVQLAREHRLILPSLAGHEGSTALAAGATIEDVAESLDRLLEKLGVEPAGFVGWSLGGAVALSLAIRRPKRVRSLLLASTAAHFAGAHAPSGRDAYRELEENQRRLLPALRGARASRLLAADAEVDVLSGYYEALRRFDCRDSLREIQVPVSVVVGAQDRILSPDAGRAITERIPRAELHVWSERGHFAPLVSHRRFVRLIRSVHAATRARANGAASKHAGLSILQVES